MQTKLIRITTIPLSLRILLKGQHRFLSSKGINILGVSSAGPDLEDVHINENVPVVGLEMTRTISPFKDIVSLWNFIKLCKKEKPTIVHSHTPKAGIIGMLGAKIAGVPIRLHTVAGMPLMESSGVKRTILNWVEKITYLCATKVYPNSKGLYNFILEQKFTTSDKLYIIGNGSSNGIDLDFFSKEKIISEKTEQIKSALGIKENDFVFIFVGRLVGDKGINELVAAFENFKDPNVKLILVGSPETKLDPLQPFTIKAIESNKNIISVGFQNDVRPYLAVSNALVFPSYREGFPNVVMQAGAMGLPSIVSNINGCNEIIIEGENGTIIPVKDITTLYHSMSRMINNKEYYAYLKSNSRRMIVERYEQKFVWEALLKEYKSLLKEIGITHV